MQALPADNVAHLINTLARANTDITISKIVAGGPAEGLNGSFNFTANCGADGNFNSTVTLTGSNAGAIAIKDVPIGASCTVTQDPTRPTPPAGYEWDNAPLEPVSLTTAPNGNTASFVSTLVRRAAPVPTAVPTLQEWGMMVLSIALLMVGATQMRNRQR